MSCPSCGTLLYDNGLCPACHRDALGSCKYCGDALFKEQYCDECGEQGDEEFCEECGEELFDDGTCRKCDSIQEERKIIRPVWIREDKLFMKLNPGGVMFEKLSEGSYRSRYFILGGQGTNRLNTHEIASKLLTSNNKSKVIELLEELGWLDVKESVQAQLSKTTQ